MSEFLLPALGHIIEPQSLFILLVGTLAGLVVGALPGLFVDWELPWQFL